MKLKIALLTLSLGAVIMALSLSAKAVECSRAFPGEAPPAPDGRTASHAEMEDAQLAIGNYVRSVESYLVCWEPLLNAVIHNQMVDRARAAADAYNAQLSVYRQQGDVALSD